MRADICPGATFPDYELTSHAKERRKLSELQGVDPMILVLSRGRFCPKDHQQMLELAEFYPRLAVSYTQLVTITTDPIFELNEFRDSVGAQWTFLSDSARKIQQDLEIQEYTDPHHDPMIPHTLVLEPGLLIHKIYDGYWFLGKALARGPTRRPARRLQDGPTRLGPNRSWASRGVGRGQQAPALPVQVTRSCT